MKALIVKNCSLEGPGSFGKYLVDKGYKLTTIDLEAGDRCPSDGDGYDIVVILGGPMNVYESSKHPYLLQEQVLIKKCLNSGIKLIGFCLGAQLLAGSLATIIKKNDRKEIGWFDIMLTHDGKESALFNGLHEKFPVFQWHGDIFELPLGATHLASSELCENQAFTYGSGIGLQFHFEVEEEDVKEWCEAYKDEVIEELGEEGIEKILSDTKKYMPYFASRAEVFYESLMEF